MQVHNILELIISSLAVTGIVALFVFGRRFMELPRQMIVITAALFRLLRSNKLQGIALEKIATCQKEGCSDGETDEAVKAVMTDQQRTDDFLRRAALARPEDLKDLMREED